MDPNATLARIREVLQEMEVFPSPALAQELTELTRALDEWLSRGGFLPMPWVQLTSVVACSVSGCDAEVDTSEAGRELHLCATHVAQGQAMFAGVEEEA